MITNAPLVHYLAARSAYQAARAVAGALMSWRTRSRADLAGLELMAARAAWLATRPPARARWRWMP